MGFSVFMFNEINGKMPNTWVMCKSQVNYLIQAGHTMKSKGIQNTKAYYNNAILYSLYNHDAGTYFSIKREKEEHEKW